MRPRAAQWVATVTFVFTELCTASCLSKHVKTGKRGPQWSRSRLAGSKGDGWEEI